MHTPQHPSSPDRTNLLIDFPVRLYTALRTIRLYPASNPQVHRSNHFVLKAFQALRESGGDDSVNIALSDQKILVCGEHLSDKDQTRPQIQGLITLLGRLKIHSFTFLSTFSLADCVTFTHTLADLLGNKELTEPMSVLLERAGIDSISVDSKRYVAVHQGEQVVRDEMIGSGLNISDEELANFVLGKSGTSNPMQAISPELIKELINRLPKATGDQQTEVQLSEAVIEVLQNLSKETNFNRHAHNIQTSAATLSGLDPVLLSKLVAHLPATPIADQILDSTLQHLMPQQLNALIAHFLAQQSTQAETGASAGTPAQAGGAVDFTAFNRMLGHYEQLLSKEQQTQVAQQAAAQLVSREGLALGNILAQKFKGLFGEQLYRQVITQVSAELLDETVDRLTPGQLNRMIATLTSDIPLQIGKDWDQEFNPADESVLKRLAQTRKGPEITTAIAHNIDARILQATSGQRAVLPEELAMRLQQPAWSAPVLVTAARQSTDPVNYRDGKADFSSFERMLDTYDTLLDKEKQLQVATEAGSHLASFDEKELGLLLVQKYKNLFGDQLYQQVINQISDQKFEKIAGQLQAISEGREALPPDLQDKNIEEAYNRLLQTVRGEKMRAIIEMNREQKNQREQAFKGGLKNLLEGELKGIEKREFAQSLPETVRNLLGEGKEEVADSLLMQLAAALQHDNAEVRTNAASALAAIADPLTTLNQWQRIGKLLPALKQGLQQEEADQQRISQTLTAIGKLTSHYLAEGKYAQANETIQFLQTFATERSRTVGANPLGREQALETLKNLCTQPVLEQLLDLCLHSDIHQETAGKLLVGMGTQSAKFQLQQLMSNESRFERKRLLELIKQTGNPAIDILLEQLHQDSPWFVIRNIIRLLGEIGNPSLFDAVRPFIGHTDLRVQQEVLNTAVKIGDENLKDFLLHALQTVADPLKSKVVNHITTAYDERFVRPLANLLESTKPFVGKNKSDLQLAICRTLGVIGSKRATASLNRVAQSKNVLGLGGFSEEVRQAAAQALEQIREIPAPLKGRECGEEEGANEQEAHSTATATGTQSITVDAEETAIFALATQGKRNRAKERLLDLITATARRGDFPAAERLRERIYEIDSLALGEIIRSGEIIEQEKQGAISEEDLAIWADLTDRLSSEEFQTMYHELSEHRYRPEQAIVSQGDKNDALFFIAQGSVKISHRVGPREIFITSLNRGQIAGENFFAPSFWTVSLTSLTPSKIYILQQATLNSWQERFPRLRTKLHQFCLTCSDIRSMLEKKGLERRQGRRFTLARKIQVQPITTLDTTIGRGFRAETVDISQGGLAFLIRISKKENARLLLGRRMQVVLPVGGQANFLYLKGLVISIQPFHIMENDFSVHFKFEYPLDQQRLQSILG